MVELIGLAGGHLRVQHGGERVYDADGGVEPGLGVLAICRQAHHGVHGEELPFVRLALAAGRERREQAEAQHEAERSFKLHLGVPRNKCFE